MVVLPAASRPSMSRRISFDPKILPIILESWPPIVAGGLCRLVCLYGEAGGGGTGGEAQAGGGRWEEKARFEAGLGFAGSSGGGARWYVEVGSGRGGSSRVSRSVHARTQRLRWLRFECGWSRAERAVSNAAGAVAGRSMRDLAGLRVRFEQGSEAIAAEQATSTVK